MDSQKKKNLRRLWDSLELSLLRRNLIIYTLLLAVTVLAASCRANSDGSVLDSTTQLAVLLITLAVCLLPYLLFCVFRTVSILRKADRYFFCKAKLSQPHHAFLIRAYSFSVLVEAPNGRLFSAETHAIFAAQAIIGPRMEDYVNSTVTLAYNEETGMLVVIG